MSSVPLGGQAAAEPHEQRCAECGSARRPERLTLAYLGLRLRDELWGSDRGLVPTFRGLLVAPQTVVLAFIRNEPRRMFGPIKYFLVALAAALLMPSLTPLDHSISAMIASKGLMTSDAAARVVADWNAALYSPLLLLLAGATRGFYRASEYNYAEHLVIAAYGWAQLILLGTLTTLLVTGLKALGIRGLVLTPLLLAPMAYWFWFCWRVFGQRFPGNALRALSSLVAAFVAYLFLVIALVQLAVDAFASGAQPA